MDLDDKRLIHLMRYAVREEVLKLALWLFVGFATIALLVKTFS